MFRILFVSFLCMFLIACQSEQVVENYEVTGGPVEKGPIKATVKLAKKELSILDRQYLTLEIHAPVEMALQYPALEERLEDYRQVPWRSEEQSVENGILTTKKYYAFELYESGEQLIPPFQVRYSSGAGEELIEGELKTPILKFNITPVDMKSIAGQSLSPALNIERPAPFPWLEVLSYVAIAIIVIIAIIFTIDKYVQKKQAPPPPPTPAHLIAYAELELIVEKQQKGELDHESFVHELTLVLRKYIENRFSIRAYEQTTEEFMDYLVSSQTPLDAHKQVLQRFLEFTDLIKFAAKKVEEEDLQKGFDFTKDFIENTKLEEVDT